MDQRYKTVPNDLLRMRKFYLVETLYFVKTKIELCGELKVGN